MRPGTSQWERAIEKSRVPVQDFRWNLGYAAGQKGTRTAHKLQLRLRAPPIPVLVFPSDTTLLWVTQELWAGEIKRFLKCAFALHTILRLSRSFLVPEP